VHAARLRLLLKKHPKQKHSSLLRA